MTLMHYVFGAALLAGAAPAGERAPVPAPSPAFALEITSQTGGAPVRMPVKVADAGRAGDAKAACEAFGVAFTLGRYEPSLRIRERFEAAPPDAGGIPVLRVAIRTQERTTERWLVPGSRTWGLAMVRQAIIECRAACAGEALGELERSLRALYDETPKLLVEVKRDGARRVFPVSVGAKLSLPDPAYAIEVLRVVKCFAIDPDTKAVKDQSEIPLNPAAEVRIAHGAEVRETWLFSQLPEFSQKAEDADARFRFVWPVKDHPHPRGEIVLIDAERGDLTAFVRTNTEVQKLTLGVGGTINVTGVELKLLERLPSARIVQETLSHPGLTAALRVSWGEGGSRWVALGGAEEVRTDGKILCLKLVAGEEAPHGLTAEPVPESGKLPPGHPPLAPQGTQPRK